MCHERPPELGPPEQVDPTPSSAATGPSPGPLPAHQRWRLPSGQGRPPAQTMNAERSQLAVAAARTRRSARSREFTVDPLSQADQVDLPGVGLALPALHRSAGPSVGAANAAAAADVLRPGEVLPRLPVRAWLRCGAGGQAPLIGCTASGLLTHQAPGS
jgi:hypothetical protein